MVDTSFGHTMEPRDSVTTVQSDGGKTCCLFSLLDLVVYSYIELCTSFTVQR